MVTCFTCRGTIDDEGHKAQCPILGEELKLWRSLLAQGGEELTKPS
jgi:hypothetical protein